MNELVIDISHWDGNIDLEAWKNRRALWGVIIKAGGNEKNLGRYTDPKFEVNYKKAKDAGLHIGYYYYTVSVDTVNSKADADHFANLIGDKFFDLPCYMDVEDPAQFRLSKRSLTDVIKIFCDTLIARGYYSGLYTGGSAWLNNMYSNELYIYADWIAWWRSTWPSEAGDIGLWQQGGIRLSDGHIVFDDVSGYTDCNWCVVNYPEKISDWKKSSFNPDDKESPMSKINPANVAALIHYDMVIDPRNGYSQSPRWGGDHPDGVKHLTIDGRDYEYKLGSYDCSSSTTTAWRQAVRYTKYEGCFGNNDGERTATMRATFVGTGLFTSSLTAAKRGDLYLNEGVHVAMCQDGGSDGVFGFDCLSEFNRDENHKASGGQPGDQDGYEAVFRTYYNDNWNTVLHYVGGLLDDVSNPKKDDGDTKDSETMLTFVMFDGCKTEHFFDGTNFHAINNEDEKKAVLNFYSKLGISIKPDAISFGSATAPWGARLIDVFSREPQFTTKEKFNKHPTNDSRFTTVNNNIAGVSKQVSQVDAKVENLLINKD